MFTFTGHPFVDVGIATVLSFANKKKPNQITNEDLEKIADYMAKNYTVNPLRSFLTVAFPNSGFTQPAYFNNPEKQQLYADKVLRSFRDETPLTNENDIFLDAPIPAVSFDVKDGLAYGRVYRQHIPLLTGEGVINFFPNGEAGMPVSGMALFLIQAFPLGCAKCAGRLLAVHSDNPEITLHFAREFLSQNRRLVQLAQESGSSKLQETHLKLKTLIVDTLLKAHELQHDYQEDNIPFSVTAYHLSNSGQQPTLDIYYLPLQIIGFLEKMLSASYRIDWGNIVQSAWGIKPPTKRRRKKAEEEKPFSPRKNFLYEDLFQLPENSLRFIRTYFLRAPLKLSKMEAGDPRPTYSTQAEIDKVSWNITEEFLRRIMHMEKERIDQIRTLGDRLAQYVREQNDKRFFREFFTESRYDYFRNRLLKANLSHVKRGNPPIIEFEPYIQVFEEGTELARPNWKLARDLVLIRMVERLANPNWFSSNPDAISDTIIENPTDSDDQN